MRCCDVRMASKILLALTLVFCFFNPYKRVLNAEIESNLCSLLPKVESWRYSEDPQDYFPETLYEYINGAAEIYLGYDFKELIVGQYKNVDFDIFFSVEIYDMRNEKNSFGIYSAERFPDNRFVSIGNQGYLEEGTLNFFVGRYYIKLLCFDCGDESESYLKFFAGEILKGIKDKGQIPPLLHHFPKEGLIPNSEKFILHNFMGHAFLHDGYSANYKQGVLEFECFLIDGKSNEEAQNMIEKYLAYQDEETIEKESFGYHLKDHYYHHIFLARVENHLCGVMKIKDGSEEIGERYLKALMMSLRAGPIIKKSSRGLDL